MYTSCRIHICTLIGSVILILVGGVTFSSPSRARCVAQDIKKLPSGEYTRYAADHTNNPTLAGLITGSSPPVEFNKRHQENGPTIDGQAWRKIHADVDKTLNEYWANRYEPRIVVCLAFTEDDYAASRRVPTYSGKRFILSAHTRPNSPQYDGTLGPNLEALQIVLATAIAAAKEVASQRCGGIGEGARYCRWYRETGQTILSAISNSHPISDPPPLYNEYYADTEDSLTQFYEDVAVQSHASLVIAAPRPIKLPNGGTLQALFFDPANESFTTTRSFLDFVEQQFIHQLNKYYVALFDLLWEPDDWKPHLASMKPKALNTIATGTNDDTRTGIAIADLLCQQKDRYDSLIAPVHQDYLLDHQRFFCNFSLIGNTQTMSFIELLAVEESFDVTGQLAASERIEQAVKQGLTELATIQLNGNALLNDIKHLVGVQAYTEQIERLQAAIQAAEARAHSPSLVETLGAVASIGSAFATGLPSLGSGLIQLTGLLGGVPFDQPIDYVIAHKTEFDDAFSALGKGSGALQTIQEGIDSITPDSHAANDLAALRDQLATVQKEYQDLLAQVAATEIHLRGEYVKKVNEQIAYADAEQSLFLIEQKLATRLALKAILCAKLAHVGELSRKACPKIVGQFVENPRAITLSLIGTQCLEFSKRTAHFAKCLEQQQGHRKGSPSRHSLIFGNTTGLLLAQELSNSQKPLSCFSNHFTSASEDRVRSN